MITFSPSPLPSLTLSHVVSPRPLMLSLSHTCLFSLSRSLISTLMISPSPFTLTLPHLPHSCYRSRATVRTASSLSNSFSRSLALSHSTNLTLSPLSHPHFLCLDIFFHGILSHTVYPYSLSYPLTLQLSLSLSLFLFYLYHSTLTHTITQSPTYL